MRILVLSSVFPNPRQPTFGVFIRERMRRVARQCSVVVVAPVPWFPMNSLVRGSLWTGIPWHEQQGDLSVHHPRFLCVPRYAKWLDGLLYGCSLIPFLARLRRDFPFDLIDAHFAYPDGVAAALLGRIFRRPVVITLRGSLVRLARYPMHRPQIRAALSAAAHVLSVSDSLRQIALTLGVPDEKVRVVGNGVDTSLFRPMDRDAARRALGLPLDRTILLSIGGINEGKGHHRIVSLLPRLRHHRPDLLYVIVGDQRPGDSFRPVIDRLIAAHGLQAHVLIAGERPHDEIPQWLAAADLFCLATRSEGRANVLLEALACARPVVTTRVGGNPEIISSDDLGILVPPTDDHALEEGILHGLERPWDASRMTAHAAAHSWEATTATVLEVFEEATGTARGRLTLGPARRPQPSRENP